ncbi:M28 family peptidase [Anditalea andensis]|uniref:Glutamine cyclotransferase n=1 Tax=Anditalea andensis TaxID=1048983 RepID=A0A074KSS9_9BACT|nr:M28 family peptidase [Anditalea andensis]KEO73021.1 glutamine cyclotransferase [Anditalea andensis]
MKSRWYYLTLLVWIVSCGRGVEPEVETAPPDIDFPEFIADSAYSFIQRQVDFGPRVPNTAPHRETKDWLVARFEQYGLTVTEQQFEARAYDGTNLNLTNIIASWNPQASKRILLAAHWDTRPMADKDTQRIDEPIDGANDGASGVGVLLEIARVITSDANQPSVGIDFILFDGEDYGEPEHTNNRNQSQIWWALGSQHWSKTPHEVGYTAYYGILLDMVGGKNARFYREGYSMQYAKNIVQKVWNNAHNLGHGDFFQMRNAGEIIDDHIFVNEIAKIPMIDIIDFSPDYGFGRFHHTHDDSMDIIDKRTLKAVGETVLYTIYQEN